MPSLKKLPVLATLVMLLAEVAFLASFIASDLALGAKLIFYVLAACSYIWLLSLGRVEDESDHRWDDEWHPICYVVLHKCPGLRDLFYIYTFPWLPILLWCNLGCFSCLDILPALAACFQALSMFLFACCTDSDTIERMGWVGKLLATSPRMLLISIPGIVLFAAAKKSWVHQGWTPEWGDCSLCHLLEVLPWLKGIHRFFDSISEPWLAPTLIGLALFFPEYGLTIRDRKAESIAHFMVILLYFWPDLVDVLTLIVNVRIEVPMWYYLLLAISSVELLVTVFVVITKPSTCRRTLGNSSTGCLSLLFCSGCRCCCCCRRRQNGDEGTSPRRSQARRVASSGLASSSPSGAQHRFTTPELSKRLRGLRNYQAHTWTSEQVGAWLDLLGLDIYKERFSQNAVNGEVLMHTSEAELVMSMDMTQRHKVSLLAGLSLLRGADEGIPSALGAALLVPPRPPRPLNFQRWGWGCEDVRLWLDALGFGLMWVELQNAGLHGALLFPAHEDNSPDLGCAPPIVQPGEAQFEPRAHLNTLASTAASLVVRLRGWSAGPRGDAQAAAAELCRRSFLTAVRAARPAYMQGFTAAELCKLAKQRSSTNVRDKCLACTQRLWFQASSIVRPGHVRMHSALWWGSAATKLWLEKNVEFPQSVAERLEELGTHGATLLDPLFGELAAAAVPEITPTLRRRLESELAKLRSKEPPAPRLDSTIQSFHGLPSDPSADASAPPLPTPGSGSPRRVPEDLSKSSQAGYAVAVRAGSCCICISQTAQCAFVPCGHRCVCEDCLHQVQALPTRNCPVCRKAFTQVVRIFD
mmetsp:Transcript_11424/g.25182  ORF Transcript_11424/g.25182 Transcript_11424/m.25182 type:complete len:810 (+) Transcript_11424:124-2553(+)